MNFGLPQCVVAQKLRDALQKYDLSSRALERAINNSSTTKITRTFIYELNHGRANENSSCYSDRVDAIFSYFKNNKGYDMQQDCESFALVKKDLLERDIKNGGLVYVDTKARFYASVAWVVSFVSLGFSIYAVIGG